MTLILQGTDNSVSSPAVQGGTAGTTTGVYYPATNQLALASNGTLALLVDGSQNISMGSGVTVNAYQGTSPSNGLWMGTVGSAGFFLANQTSTNTNLYLSKASGYTDASLLTTYVNGVTLGGLRVTSGNTAMNLYGISGITFPATQIASSDANTLDDYEEGSWTPTDGSGASLTFTGISAQYVKVGSMILLMATLTYPSTSSTAGATISGLPFTIYSYGGGSTQYTSGTNPGSLAFRNTGGASGGSSLIVTSGVSNGTAVNNISLSSATFQFWFMGRTLTT